MTKKTNLKQQQHSERWVHSGWFKKNCNILCFELQWSLLNFDAWTRISDRRTINNKQINRTNVPFVGNCRLSNEHKENHNWHHNSDVLFVISYEKKDVMTQNKPSQSNECQRHLILLYIDCLFDMVSNGKLKCFMRMGNNGCLLIILKLKQWKKRKMRTQRIIKIKTLA